MTIELINDAVRKLVSLECWDCHMLPDSMVLSFALGAKIPDTSRQAQKYKPVDRFRSEWCLWIECSWRLDQGNRVVTVWTDAGPVPDGPMVRGIAELYGRRIVRVAVEPPAWDLAVEFEDGYTLKVFSSTSENAEYQDAWTVFHENDLVISIGPKGRWSTDKSRPADTWD